MENRSQSSEHDFTISRVLNAPRDLVFHAWIDPEQMAKWWGPESFANPVCEMDARPGGSYKIVMRSPEGIDYPVKGVFVEVLFPERLVMTLDCSEHPAEWHDMIKPDRAESENNPAGILLQTVTFEDLDGKTKLTIRTRFESKTIRDAMLKIGMTEGWSESLDRLEKSITALNSSTTHVSSGLSESDPASSPDREIVTTRVLDAPRELVFEAWTNPKHIGKWWGPNGFTTTIHEMDVRPGGYWRFVMHGPDGVDYQNENIYLEVTKPERLIFRHTAPAFQMTVTFDQSGSRTLITMRMLFDSASERDRVVRVFGAIEGAKQTLERLQAFVVTNGANE